MNYYERHLGDYSKDTAHLSMIEHGAYGLLLDRYYSTERAIPADQAYRIARAQKKEEKNAVDVVLQEFFYLSDDGWKNKRCDEEIEKYSKKKPESESKKENDRERQRRSRDRRKTLFESLRTYGIVAPWDASTEELQAALSQACHQGCHEYVTPPVTRDNTANHTPDTSNQTPDTININTHTGESPPGTPTKAAAVCVLLKSEGIGSVNPNHPKLIELIEDGAEIGMFSEAARVAREKQKGFAYVLGTVRGQMQEARLMAAQARAAPAKQHETARQRSARERIAEFAPNSARQAPDAPNQFSNFIEEVKNVTAIERH